MAGQKSGPGCFALRGEAFFWLDVLHQLSVFSGVKEIAALSFGYFWVTDKTEQPSWAPIKNKQTAKNYVAPAVRSGDDLFIKGYTVFDRNSGLPATQKLQFSIIKIKTRGCFYKLPRVFLFCKFCHKYLTINAINGGMLCLNIAKNKSESKSQQEGEKAWAPRCCV